MLYKIFSRKTLKISYSCSKNIFEIINNHNKEIIRNFMTERIIIIIIIIITILIIQVNKTNEIVKPEKNVL